jgi:predicted membrane channel-forming protein YqfA (hemolysin III family)
MIVGALIVFPISFTDRFQDRARPILRVSVYLCLAVLTVVPLTHMTINELLFNNYNQAFSLSNSMPWYILGLVFYAIGGFFYVSQ